MFTGLIEDIGRIKKIRGKIDGCEFSIETSLKEIFEGDSIAIDGVCLTVKEIEGSIFKVDCSKETLKVTTLKEKEEGQRVNIERALRLDRRLGGHLVLGHIDGVGRIKEKRREGDSILITIEFPHELEIYVVKKGSIAVDGISLTVNEVNDNKFTVNIIPYTALKTTIAEKRKGEKVNIEVDIIGKYVEKLLRRGGLGGRFSKKSMIKEVEGDDLLY